MIKNSLISLLSKILKHFPKQILSLRYYRWTNKKLNWDNPQDLQQLILSSYINKYKNNDLKKYADLTDKIKVRDFVEKKIGKEYLTELFGVWGSAQDLDFDKLPNQFVLKTNNGCGTNIIVKDKEKMDKVDLVKNLNNWLHFPYGELTGQPHYSLINPHILAEEFLIQSQTKDILPYDYKIFCFNGEPKFILYYEDRKINGHIAKNMVFDVNWKPMTQYLKNPTDHSIPKPKSLNEMIEIAKKLSKDFEFVRVDLYEIDGKPKFGELTFTPDVMTYFKDDFLNIKNFKS